MKRILLPVSVLGLILSSSRAMAGAQAERVLEQRQRTRIARQLSLDPETASDSEIDEAIEASGLSLGRVEAPMSKLGPVAAAEIAANPDKWSGFAVDPDSAENDRLKAFLKENPKKLDKLALAEIAAHPVKWRGIWDGGASDQ